MKNAGHRIGSVKELDTYIRNPRGITSHVQVCRLRGYHFEEPIFGVILVAFSCISRALANLEQGFGASHNLFWGFYRH